MENTESVTEVSENVTEAAAELVKLDMEGFQWPAGMISKKEPSIDEIFREYEKMQEEGREIEVSFATASASGNLDLRDGDIKLRMRPEEMDGPVWSHRARKQMKDGRGYTTRMLGKTYHVKVIKVDRRNNTIFVSERAAHVDLKKRVLEKMREILSRNGHAVVPARVIGVSPEIPTQVVVSIGDIGIIGLVPRSEWARTYVANLSAAVKPGQMIMVAVRGRAAWSDRLGINRVDREECMYMCSRSEVLEKDPWEGVEEKYPVKIGVRVRCVSVLPGRFFASVEGLDEINAACLIDDRAEHPVKPVIGREYLGYVFHVNEKEHKLKVRIIGEVTNEEDDIEGQSIEQE